MLCDNRLTCIQKLCGYLDHPCGFRVMVVIEVEGLTAPSLNHLTDERTSLDLTQFSDGQFISNSM